jgi:hypothetical protein
VRLDGHDGQALHSRVRIRPRLRHRLGLQISREQLDEHDLRQGMREALT